MVTVHGVLAAWQFDPTPTLGVAIAGLLYLAARRRLTRDREGVLRHSARSPNRLLFFLAGLLAIVVAVDGPPDVLSDAGAFSAHMVQHLLLQMVAAPLLLLGAPVSVVLRADPPWLRRHVLVAILRSRAVRVLTHPVTALALFAVFLVGSHLSPLYNLALEREWVHEIEHICYLLTALLFWWPALGVDPAPQRIGYPARLLYLFLAMPVTAFLGVAIASAPHVMYPYYLAHPPPWGSTPLADQRLAGTLMWVSGMFTIVPAMAAVLLRWLDEDARRQARSDARRDSRGYAGQVRS